jgi:hypothetical protein
MYTTTHKLLHIPTSSSHPTSSSKTITMNAAQQKICYSYVACGFGLGTIVLLGSLLYDEPPVKNFFDFMGKNICCFASGMLGHLRIVARQLNAEAAKAQRENHNNPKSSPKSSTNSPESSTASTMYTPTTEDSQWISDEETPEPLTEDKIAALIKERKELVANDFEDAYALKAAAVQRRESFTIYMRSTDEGADQAKQNWVAASRKYDELALLRDKKNLRLARIGLDIAAQKKGMPGLLW